MVTYEALRRDAAVNTYITRADESLSALGFTEHSFPHVCRVAEVAGQVLNALGYDSHQIELAKIAALPPRHRQSCQPGGPLPERGGDGLPHPGPHGHGRR